ncbi:sensor domain-containing protein [Mycobacteroides abscessus]|uniref:sensor domain-containing protein n=2 Tax=Mycobacteroides abscessus TaxID=36809 RepID=UPI000927D2A6|nr:sensor domain-containing protein [Mycobacteroides abscessus]SHR46558.1 Hypothetical conserved lipoprotein LppR [Mycobacteroides abscessus subsp. bolletii]SHT27298.1 Hypothetical conserved lipoprotein LppR [Mycobacteroides abscessus subsp. bolletii]SHT60044.1 Hypothetical conserved lipoprotein LppR [Mycobacteroides abscessus subsp. bolletii]SKH04958.1 Hypothetical conserved lipoprotein LppR [Mycobacteroides abscessus subsp. bolletii]SKH14951.1 Hypothetical conserved lipoprotein LppR [Mycobac
MWLRMPLWLALFAMVGALSGCSELVAGQAIRPAPSPGPPQRPITKVLPDQVELSRALGSPMRARYGGRPGKVEVLPNGLTGASPVECIKVHAPAMRQTYRQAPVRAAIRITWKTDTGRIRFPTPHLKTTFGVIELDTPDNARFWYRRFAADWHQCQGKTATIDRANYTIRYDIGRTSDAGDLLTTVLMFSGTGTSRPMPVQRILAQVSRYLIDVEIMDFSYLGHPAEPGITDKAEAITQLITDKINTVGHV